MKLSTKNVSKYAIQRLFNMLLRNIKYANKKILLVLARTLECTSKGYEMYS